MSTETASAPVVVVLHGDALPPGRECLDRKEGPAEVRYATADTVESALPGAQVLLVWDLFTEALTAAWPKADALEWVHAATTGVDNLMFPALVESDVVVTNSRGVFDRPIAESVLGMVISFAKGLHITRDLQRERTWEWRETERIEGRHALVIGTGGIGRAIARMLSAAGLTVEGAGRTPRSDDPDFGTVVEATVDRPGEGLDAALPRADFVIMAAPLTPATRGLIGAPAFARMRSTARFINVGRGPSVVEPDLVEALRDGVIAGAALDVFEREPLPPDSALWTMPQVIVSPHMSGDVVGWRGELFAMFLDQLDRRLAGDALHNVVDKDRGYPG